MGSRPAVGSPRPASARLTPRAATTPEPVLPYLALIVRGTALAAAALGLTVGQARAADRVAVFPFELLDNSQSDELYPQVRPEETERLARLTEDLKARLLASNRFEIAALDAIADDVKNAAPIYKCNGCEADLAKKTGADIAMLGLVQKFSDTLLSVNIEVVDAHTGKVTAYYSAGVQGNTDEAWMRALRHIVKYQIVSEGAAP